jgi:hypothetical protein
MKEKRVLKYFDKSIIPGWEGTALLAPPKPELAPVIKNYQ